MACFFEVGCEGGRHNDGSWYPFGEGLGDGLEFGIQKTEFYFLINEHFMSEIRTQIKHFKGKTGST